MLAGGVLGVSKLCASTDDEPEMSGCVPPAWRLTGEAATRTREKATRTRRWRGRSILLEVGSFLLVWVLSRRVSET